MRVGVHLRIPTTAEAGMDALLDEAVTAHRLGLDLWIPQTNDGDALTALGVVGRVCPGMRLGTSCVPIWPRHPLVVAMQALTVQAATGNRLTLGVGLSHRPLVESEYGIPFERAVRYMREYLAILGPLLGGSGVDYQGELLTARFAGRLDVAGARPPSVLVAALGPQMLDVAGRLAEGALLWMVGPKTLASHIVPRLTEAAAGAGRGRPEVVVGLPVCVTSDAGRARAEVAAAYAAYGDLPSYRRILDLEGAAGPGDVALIGDEATVRSALSSLAEAGATALSLRPTGSPAEQARTLEVLASLKV